VEPESRIPSPLPAPPLKARAHNQLRRVKQRWRTAFPRPLPAWSGPDGTAPFEPAVVSHDGGQLEVTGESVGAIRATTDLGPAVRGLVLNVTLWRSPWPGWSGRLGPVPGLVAHAVQLPTGAGPARVTIEVAEPIAADRLLEAALAVLEPARPLPATVSPAIAVDEGPRPPWLRAPHTGPPSAAAVPAADLRVVATTSRYGGAGQEVLVDAATANPIGRGPGGHDLPTGELSLSTGGAGEVWWRVHTRTPNPRLVVAGRAGDPLSDAHRIALARLGSVFHADAAAGCAELPQASVLAQLATTGVVLQASDLRAATRALLATELRDIITEPVPGAGTDPLEWELRSIRQRRAALRGHGAGLAVAALRPGTAGVGIPTVSALLVTRRPGYVARAVGELAAQSYPGLEIVVGLHGVDLAADDLAELRRAPVPVEVVRIPAEVTFGTALATATRAARGSLITKADDDDRYGPEHVWDLVLARDFSGAVAVGKAAEFVHIAAHDATVRRRMESELYTDVVAGGTILLSRGDLEAVGGWRPLARAVDRALLDRVLEAGGLVYRTHGFGFVYSRHDDGHTWDPGTRYFLLNPLRHWSGQPPFAEFGGNRPDP